MKAFLQQLWHDPKRTWLRRALFQVHLWAGIIVGLWAVLIGLTGSVIVFRHELAARVDPQLYHAEPLPQRALLQPALNQLLAAHPGYELKAVRGFEREAHTLQALLESKTQTPRELLAFINPYTGAIVAVQAPTADWMNWIWELHMRLLGGQVGLWINGGLAFVMLTLTLTGLLIWWRGRLIWKAGLVIKRGVGWKRFNFDLHNAGGFWTSLWLGWQSLSGIFFAAPIVFILPAVLLTGGSVQQLQSVFVVPKVTMAEEPLATRSVATVDDALAQAQRALPDHQLGAVQYSPQRDEAWRIALRPPHGERVGRLALVNFDPYQNKILNVLRSNEQNIGLQATLFLAPLHFGTVGGLATKILWLLLGLAPGALFVTGFVMWWNRVVSKKLRAHC